MPQIFPKAANPALRLPGDYVSSDLERVEWSSLRLDDWDYVLVRTKPSAPSPAVPERLDLVAHTGGWWLYATPAVGRIVACICSEL